MQFQLAPKDFVAVTPGQPARRVASLDALRGFNILWIVGGDGAVRALANMCADKGPVLSGIGQFLDRQLRHSAWEGLTFYDFIFPLFIFVTGVAIVFSLSRLVEREGLRKAHLRVLRRALLLYGLGIIYYGGISHHWTDIRYLGILQRIALCYLFTSLMFLNFNLRGMGAAFVALLVGYWVLMTYVPVPGIGVGSFGPDANLANWLDSHYLPGRLWDVTRDPEGMLSTLPAIGTCLLGVFAGLLLKNERLAPQRKSLWPIGAGVVLVIAGHLWGLQFPVIKAIWTSSFVLVAGGYSLVLLGVWHQIIDVWGLRAWATFFVWIGANTVTLYFLNNIFGFEPFALRFVGGDFSVLVDRLTTPGTGLLLAHLVGIGFAVALAGFLYRRKIFLRV